MKGFPLAYNTRFENLRGMLRRPPEPADPPSAAVTVYWRWRQPWVSGYKLPVESVIVSDSAIRRLVASLLPNCRAQLMTSSPPDDPDSSSPTSRENAVLLPSAEEAAVMLRAAIGQIEFARQYTLQLLDATPRERWYEIPPGSVTNIAWQVGHLAVSEYGLMMFRIRGRRPDDLDLIPGRFRKTFGRGSTPPQSPSGHPSPTELLEKLNDVHQSAMNEIANVEPEVLLADVEMPYAVYPCKLGAILFCPMHETLHAGQIGVTRRGLGLEPIR